jgi:hypothetical protein
MVSMKWTGTGTLSVEDRFDIMPVQIEKKAP